MNITVSTCCAVGIATRYGLDGPGIESRCGARFFAPVQTGPGTYSASCTMGTGSFPGVKRPGRGADHPSSSKCRGQERVWLYLYSPSGPSWPVIGSTFTLQPTFCGQKTVPYHIHLPCEKSGIQVLISKFNSKIMRYSSIRDITPPDWVLGSRRFDTK